MADPQRLTDFSQGSACQVQPPDGVVKVRLGMLEGALTLQHLFSALTGIMEMFWMQHVYLSIIIDK